MNASRTPQEAAAGLKALQVTWQHARRQTGALRALRVLAQANQAEGFDCPGCAWPDPESRSPFEFCENGAKAILDEATNKKVDAKFFERHSIAELLDKEESWLNKQGRITQPLVRRPDADSYTPINYDEAFQLVATELRTLDSPHEAAFYTSGRTSNEAAFLYQLMVRTFGTNNLPDCSNLCHESSGVALKETLGIGKGTVRLDDFSRADLIFVVGQNPGTSHPRMLSALREAKLSGATIVSVNPLIERGLVKFAHPQEPDDLIGGGVEISNEFVRVTVNGDQAFFRGLNKALLDSSQRNAVDRAFIEEHCQGFEDFSETARATPWPQIEQHSGLSRERIQEIAELVLRSKNIICCWAMGLTQHENAVITLQEVTNFLLLRGNIGKPGAGACPVRGHSNVQGDRTVGIAPTLPPSFAQALSDVCGVPSIQQRGFDTVTTIQKMYSGEVKALVSLGGNFLSASPDTEFTATALKKCRLTAHIATKLNRSHLVTGKTALLLPCLGRTEADETGGLTQFVTVENSMGIVHRSQGHLAPADPTLRSEPALVAGLANALLGNATPVDFSHLIQDYDRIRDLIEAVIPGFDSYNQRVRAPGGFELPNGPRQRTFTTTTGKAQFISSSLRRVEARDGELLLTTIRSHDQFNTTVYTHDDRYRGVKHNRRILLLSQEDLEERGLTSGQKLTVTSFFQPSDGPEQKRTLKNLTAIAYDVPRGTAAAYFPEANPLIFVDSFAERSRTPTSKSVRIKITGT